MMQLYDNGDLPPKPSSVIGSVSGTNIAVNVSKGGRCISLASIHLPSGSGPVPTIIGLGGRNAVSHVKPPWTYTYEWLEKVIDCNELRTKDSDTYDWRRANQGRAPRYGR
ncbi:hypothetical protein CVT25_003935 [Psilocybe cyanescens]|uniref:Uncharacterized protein n=1 Tax=Psilocybe cyanescens TaxID=93625 RepID=A0A409XW40_PSICY|nr:hypothetical protein CVT25_003935 [Psilocybe cyanescens]